MGSGTGAVGSKAGHCCCPWQCSAGPRLQLEPQPRSPRSEQLCSGSPGASLSLPHCPEERPELLVLASAARQHRVTVASQPGASAPCSGTAEGLGTVPLSPCKCSLSPGACSWVQIISSQCNLQISPGPWSPAESSRLLKVLWQLWELLAGNPGLASKPAPHSGPNITSL